VTRAEIALLVGGVLGYITGLTKALMTPVESIFFGFAEPVQVAVFVGLIAVGMWVMARRLSHRRRLLDQARDLGSG
jgi:hypothetical protein